MWEKYLKLITILFLYKFLIKKLRSFNFVKIARILEFFKYPKHLCLVTVLPIQRSAHSCDKLLICLHIGLARNFGV